nr:tuberin-like [Cherax quadricarinatus]XP_053653235.1 tuberin-like [Cherax quadricarinatus]
MSKDKGKFPERLKRWFRTDRGNVPPGLRITVTKELITELSSASPLATRLKAITELTELLATRKLPESGIAKIWKEVKDLVVAHSPAERSRPTLKMLTALALAHSDDMGYMRLVFFNHISLNFEKEKHLVFDFLSGIICQGKNIEHIEERAGLLIVQWLKDLLDSPRSNDVLNVVNNLVKFNSSSLQGNVIYGFAMIISIRLHGALSEAEAICCLNVLESLIAYNSMHYEALDTVLYALVRVVNSPKIAQLTFRITRSLFSAEHGRTCLNILCRILVNATDELIARGSLFFLANVLWGPKKIETLDCEIVSLYPSITTASQNPSKLVVFEVAMSVQKLLSSQGTTMKESTWSVVLEMMNNAYRNTISLDECPDKDSILDILGDVMKYIEELMEAETFNGKPEDFYVLVIKYSNYRPENSVLRLMDFQAKSTASFHEKWLNNLDMLFIQHYRPDPRANVKIKALEILEDVYNTNRNIYGTELVRDVILTNLNDAETLTDIKVRTCVAKFLVQVVLTHQSDLVLDVVGILEKVLLAPYGREEVSPLRERETDDIVIAVDGLIQAFKAKIWTLPSSHAIEIYKLLLSYLEQHYCNKIIFEKVYSVRYMILEMILEMRVDQKYQIGFMRSDEHFVGGVDPMAQFSQFSQFLILERKPLDHDDECCVLVQEDTEYLTCSPPKISSWLRRRVRVVSFTGNFQRRVNENDQSLFSFTKARRLIITVLQQERDWLVLGAVLGMLLKVLENKILIPAIGNSDLDFLASALMSLIMDRSLGLPASLYNVPNAFTMSDFHSHVYPVLTMLIPHKHHLKPIVQLKIIGCLQNGIINKISGPLCVSSITLCLLEMEASMVKVINKVIFSFARISATVSNSRAMMEFLSTLLHFPNVYCNFVTEHYKEAFAIALSYTNPEKFNYYIISLAYRVIAMWFIKCRVAFRKDFVSFITQGLDQILSEVTSMKTSSSTDKKKTKVKAKAKKIQAKEREEELKKAQDMIDYFNDLRDTCIDLMSRCTDGVCSPYTKGSVMEGGRTKTWIVGYKIITISTSGCTQYALKSGFCEVCEDICLPRRGLKHAETTQASAATGTIETSASPETTLSASPETTLSASPETTLSASPETTPSASPEGTEPSASPEGTEPSASPEGTEPSASTEGTEPSASTEGAEPSASTEGTEPSASTEGTEPSASTEGTEPSASTEGTEPSASTEGTEPSASTEGTEPSASTEGTEPSASTEGTEPSASTEGTEPSASTEGTEPSASTEGTEPSASTEGTEPSASAEGTEPSASAEGTEPSASAEGTEPSASAEGTEPSASAEGTEPSASAEGTEPSASAEGTEPSASAEGTEPSASAEGTEPSASAEGTEPSASAEGTEPSASAEGTEPSASAEGTEPSASAEGTEPSASPEATQAPLLPETTLISESSDSSLTPLSPERSLTYFCPERCQPSVRFDPVPVYISPESAYLQPESIPVSLPRNLAALPPEAAAALPPEAAAALPPEAAAALPPEGAAALPPEAAVSDSSFGILSMKSLSLSESDLRGSRFTQSGAQTWDPHTGRRVPRSSLPGRKVPSSSLTDLSLSGRSTPSSPLQGRGAPGSPVQGRGTPGSPVQGRGTPGSSVQGRGTPGSSVQGRGSLVHPSRVVVRLVHPSRVVVRLVHPSRVVVRLVHPSRVVVRLVHPSRVVVRLVHPSRVVVRLVHPSRVVVRLVHPSRVVVRLVHPSRVVVRLVHPSRVVVRLVHPSRVVVRLVHPSRVVVRLVHPSRVVVRLVHPSRVVVRLVHPSRVVVRLVHPSRVVVRLVHPSRSWYAWFNTWS